MSKAGKRLIKAAQEALEYAKGQRKGFRAHVPDDINVRAIRKRLGLSQTAFADRFGFAASALRDWEQGRRQPDRSARILLTVIAKEPEAVGRALQ